MGYHILVVDDDKQVSQMLATAIRMAGYCALTASDGRKALKALHNKKENLEPVDMVITDIDMPNMGGIELTEQISLEFPGLPVIAMTSYGNKDVVVQLLRNGVCEYMDKPVMPEFVISRIKTILEGSDRPGICAEITKLRKTMKEAVSHKVEKEKNELIKMLKGGLQHSFNQPLTVLMANISMLSQMASSEKLGEMEQETIIDMIEDMRNASYCIKDLLEALKKMDMLKTGSYAEDKRIVDISAQ